MINLNKILDNVLNLYLSPSQIENIKEFLKKWNYEIFPHFLKKGYRGLVLLLKKDKNFFILKIKRKDNIKSLNREYYFLKKLEIYDLAPKVYYFDENSQFLIMEFIKGTSLFLYKEIFKKGILPQNKLISYIKNISKKTFLLDKLKIFHGELLRGKHIYLYKDNVKFIDFESSKKSDKPKNFLQFWGGNILNDNDLLKLLNISKDNIIEFLNFYKDNFEKLNEEVIEEKLREILKI